MGVGRGITAAPRELLRSEDGFGCGAFACRPRFCRGGRTFTLPDETRDAVRGVRWAFEGTRATKVTMYTQA